MAEIFAELGMKLDAVIAIMIDPEILISRITGRRTCVACNTIVNLSNESQKDLTQCPNCGGELLHRDDDNETTVRKRIEAYNEQTKPLLTYYKDQNVLASVDGLGTIEEVRGRINQVLESQDLN